MDHIQRYVSSELSHFVGRGKPEEEQYDLLVNKVLKSGWLTYWPHDPTAPRTASLDLSKPISTDEIIKYQVICFCDIPVSDLSIHVAKYSKFGLAFKKDFLIARGACPVFYVANESSMPPGMEVFNPGDFSQRIEAVRAKGVLDRALYFDTSVRGIVDLLAALDAMCSEQDSTRYFKGLSAAEASGRFATILGVSTQQVATVEGMLRGNAQAARSLRICIDFLLNHVFTFMKCFDAKRSFEDESNYYMEREWRVGANVQFGLGNVARVFFPSKYAARFRKDVPQYVGQVSFID